MGSIQNDIPKNFLIAVLDKLEEPLKLLEVSSPRDLEVGQVFVRLIKSGVCASQIHEIDGRKGPDPYLPHALGHEGVGEVVGIGKGVSTVEKGDTVILHWRIGSGIQAPPARYDSPCGMISAGPVTTFGEYAIVSENRVTKLPKSLDHDLAPLFGCSLTTGFGSVVREAKVTPGESAVIIGFGGVGIAILKSLKLVSAGPIVVFDVDEKKIELAIAMGADFAQVVDASDDSLKDRAVASVGRKPDVVFEVTGHRHLIEQGYDMTDAYGRTILVGVPKASEPATLATLPLHLGKRLIGSHGGSSEPERDIPRIAELLRSGNLVLGDIPISTYSLAEINVAINSIREGIVGRVLVSMDSKISK